MTLPPVLWARACPPQRAPLCGNKLDGRDNHVFVFVGDGECDEGQVWEAAQFAAHYKLDNLICFVDDNKYQLDGAVDKVMSHGKGIGAKFALLAGT